MLYHEYILDCIMRKGMECSLLSASKTFIEETGKKLVVLMCCIRFMSFPDASCQNKGAGRSEADI